MELILEKELEHQQQAVNAIASVFDDVVIEAAHVSIENPTFDYESGVLARNLAVIQKKIRSEYRGICKNSE